MSKELPKDFFGDTTDDMDTGNTPAKHGVDHDEVEGMFDFVLSNLKEGDFKELIENIYSQWENTGSLSEKQYSTLEKAYVNQTLPRKRDDWRW